MASELNKELQQMYNNIERKMKQRALADVFTDDHLMVYKNTMRVIKDLSGRQVTLQVDEPKGVGGFYTISHSGTRLLSGYLSKVFLELDVNEDSFCFFYFIKVSLKPKNLQVYVNVIDPFTVDRKSFCIDTIEESLIKFMINPYEGM